MKLGDFIRVPSGTGTQLARIKAIGENADGDKIVIVRRFRERSQKWNKHHDIYNRVELERILRSLR